MTFEAFSAHFKEQQQLETTMILTNSCDFLFKKKDIKNNQVVAKME